jgi:hypothetical protein
MTNVTSPSCLESHCESIYVVIVAERVGEMRTTCWEKWGDGAGTHSVELVALILTLPKHVSGGGHSDTLKICFWPPRSLPHQVQFEYGHTKNWSNSFETRFETALQSFLDDDHFSKLKISKASAKVFKRLCAEGGDEQNEADALLAMSW